MIERLDNFVHHHQQPLLYLYGILLALAAVAFAVAVTRYSKAMERVPEPGEPLTWRAGIPPLISLSMGMLFLLMSIPFFVTHLADFGEELGRAPGRTGFLLLFAATGLALMAGGAGRWRRERGAHRELHLGEVSLRPGGTVSGHYRIATGRGDGTPVRVHLILQRVQIQESRRNERQLVERALWSDTLEVRPRRRGEGAEVPFRFELPARLPAPQEGRGRPEWVLAREGGGLGRAIHMVRAGEAALAAWSGARREAVMEGPQPELPQPGASAQVARAGQGPLAELAQLLFVALLPWVLWFAWDHQRQPWLHLREQLPPVLLGGAITLTIFATAVFGLIVWALEDTTQARRPWRRALALALAGDTVILVGAGLWLARHGLPQVRGPWLDTVMEFLSGPGVRSFIGMFLWISLITPFAGIRHFLRRRRDA